MNNIASVVLVNTTNSYDKEYHYKIPEHLQDKVLPGVRVVVPFGASDRSVEGYVLGLLEKSDFSNLKTVSSIVKQEAMLGQDMIKLALWMKKRYICTFYDAIKCMIPAGVFNLKGKEKVIKLAYLIRGQEEVLDDIENNKILKIQHIRILEMLVENQYASIDDIIRFSGGSRGALDTLKKKGYIDFKEVKVEGDIVKAKEYKATKALKPTEEQAFAINKIGEKILTNNFYEVLLHGITGSGKTEVYLQTIEKCIKEGKRAIVLVPEISLTPQTVERFAGRFGDNVAVLHSRLSMGERLEQWRKIKNEKAFVVVGARSAVFAPFKRLGVIIIDEEHEHTYKAESVPKYDAKEVARRRCIEHDAVLLLGSATPSIETYYRAKRGEIGLVELKNRANNAKLPKVDVVDMREELANGNRTMFSDKLRCALEKNIMAKEQSIIFLNKRGYQSFLLCRECGYTVKCLNCNVTLTHHSQGERLICHYCGYTIKSIKACPKCKSVNIKGFGAGTQKVEEEIKKAFPGVSTLRMDIDTTTYKNSHEAILKEFRENNTDILIGTQMIAKGLDFPNVTLVGVLAADSMLNYGDFRASERTFQLVTQVAGRAGRGAKPGRVVIQSYNVEDYSIIDACNCDYKAFYKKEIMLREKLEYPPFTNIAVIILSGVEDRKVFEESEKAKKFLTLTSAPSTLSTTASLSPHSQPLFQNQEREMKSGEGNEIRRGELVLLGPVRAPITKIKNKYRWRIIIKCKNMDDIIDTLTHFSKNFKANKDVKVSININPYNML